MTMVITKFHKPIVSVDWLNENLKATNLVILNASIPKVSETNVADNEFCIPNSRFFNLKQNFSDVSAPFPNTMPSKDQFEKFLTLYQKITSLLGYKPMRHMLNSNGIVRFSQYQWEMVRLGIGLYGIDDSDQLGSELERVHTFKATISQIRNIAPNATVGYGRSGKVTENKRIATISVGYADGFLRKAGNGNYEVQIRGKKAPTIGNICMDMSMVDITGLTCQESDQVELIGDHITIDDLAERMETIPYEVLTSIPPRIKRRYIKCLKFNCIF